MRRKKRFTIRLVALGFAVAAFAAPAAQAIPEGLNGVELRALNAGSEIAVSPDDRVIHGTGYSAPSDVAVTPDDRVLHGPPRPEAPTASTDDSGYDFSTGAVSGIVLLLAAAGMTSFAVYQSRKGRLASA